VLPLLLPLLATVVFEDDGALVESDPGGGRVRVSI
jgi:hypothetical protein